MLAFTGPSTFVSVSLSFLYLLTTNLCRSHDIKGHQHVKNMASRTSEQQSITCMQPAHAQLRAFLGLLHTLVSVILSISFDWLHA